MKPHGPDSHCIEERSARVTGEMQTEFVRLC